MAVSKVGMSEVILPTMLALLVEILLTVMAYSIFTGITTIDRANAASLAGHYGAVSSVTLALSLRYLDNIAVRFEQFVPALYPFMDIAALVTAVVLGRAGMAAKNGSRSVPLTRLIYEAMISKSSLLQW